MFVNSSVYFTIDLQAMSDDLIRNTTDLGELRAAFLSLKHAHDKQFFVDNFDELLIFAEAESLEFSLSDRRFRQNTEGVYFLINK